MWVSGTSVTCGALLPGADFDCILGRGEGERAHACMRDRQDRWDKHMPRHMHILARVATNAVPNDVDNGTHAHVAVAAPKDMTVPAIRAHMNMHRRCPCRGLELSGCDCYT